MDKRDALLHKGLVKILNDASFPIQRREAIILHQICEWVERDLPDRLKAAELHKACSTKKVTRKKKA